MLQFFHYNNWSRLVNSDSDPINYLNLKRNILFSRFCIISALAAIIQGFYDYWDGFPFVMGLDFGIVGFLILGYLLNEQRHHNTAKVVVFTCANLSLFGLSAVVPKEIGVYLLFFPLIVFSIIVFDFKQRFYTYFFTAISILLNLILVLTQYHPFGDINLQPSDPTISFTLNLFIAIILISVGVDFLLSITNNAEKKLTESYQKSVLLASELKKKNSALEKTNEELDQFVYSASHDLKSPLDSVTGLLNLIKLEPDQSPKNIRKYHQMIEQRIDGLYGFIKDILDYSKNVRTGLIRTETNIEKLIDEIIAHNTYLTKADKISISKKISVGDNIWVDKIRLFRIVNNLVSNAVKYNDMSKANPYIVITAKVDEGKLIIRIKDNGEGIAKEREGKIFNMFYRGTQSSTGSGLGLYIAKEMVEKMNGSIAFTSQVGVGTEFEFSIPLTDKPA